MKKSKKSPSRKKPARDKWTPPGVLADWSDLHTGDIVCDPSNKRLIELMVLGVTATKVRLVTEDPHFMYWDEPLDNFTATGYRLLRRAATCETV